MQIIGSLIVRLFNISMPFFQYEVTVGQVFFFTSVASLLLYFIKRIFA